jgi:CBS domain-containing protein
MQPSGVITGIISRKELYHHLAVRVVPDKILSRIISERYPRKYLECVLNLKAGDIMKKPVLLHQENDLEEVFCIMQNSGAEILPVLDRSGQLINCLHLHDLLSYWSQNSQNN